MSQSQYLEEGPRPISELLEIVLQRHACRQTNETTETILSPNSPDSVAMVKSDVCSNKPFRFR